MEEEDDPFRSCEVDEEDLDEDLDDSYKELARELLGETEMKTSETLAELKRQGLNNESWKISRINEGYELCDTYPQVSNEHFLYHGDEVCT